MARKLSLGRKPLIDLELTTLCYTVLSLAAFLLERCGLVNRRPQNQ